MRNILLSLVFFLAGVSLPAQNNSKFISQTAPMYVHPGEVFTVTVAFRNEGGTTWTAEGRYSLGTQNPQDNVIWLGTNRVPLPHDVAPGEEVTFTIELTAPASIEYPGGIQWRMVQDGVEWFGDFSNIQPVGVFPADEPDTLLAGESAFSVEDHVVSTSLFHWYGPGSWQVAGPWLPIEGRESWTGTVDFWKRMVKQLMAANIDVLYVILIPTMEQQRIYLFRALYELRKQGWKVPRVAPFFDPQITYTLLGYHGDASTEEGKDEIVGHYIRFYQQYYSQNPDLFADDFVYQLDSIPVIDVWHVHLLIDNYDMLTREDVTSRLAQAFGADHPIFNNGVKLVGNAVSPTFPFVDEKANQFAGLEYYVEDECNGIVTASIKPGYWDQNIRDPGHFLPRDGGTRYRDAWKQVSNTIHRVYIESFNEYDEGSGIYAARTDTVYRIAANPNTDVWSYNDDPFEYIKTTAEGAALFNDNDSLGAEIIWHNIPDTMARSENYYATILVRNTGNISWRGDDGFLLGEIEGLDSVLFGPARYPINDEEDEIPLYGGIFRGKVKAFNIEITAPDSVGDFLTHWSMLREETWFGDTLVKNIITTPDYLFREKESICQGEVIHWHDRTISEGGTYYDSARTINGYDSIYILDLSVNYVDTGVYHNDYAMRAVVEDAIFQWYDCQNGNIVEGENERTFYPEYNSSYALVITQNGCTDTSSCYYLIATGKNDLQAVEREFVIYPNPVSHDGIITIAGAFEKNDRVGIYNLQGAGLCVFKVEESRNTLQIVPQEYHLKQGIYILKIDGVHRAETFRIVVQ